MTVGLDPMWQASQIRIREQFLPALEVEGRLYFRGMEPLMRVSSVADGDAFGKIEVILEGD